MADETFDPNKAAGMTYEDAAKFFRKHGYTIRKTRINGQPTIVTRDYRKDRINVSVVDGIVTDLTSVG